MRKVLFTSHLANFSKFNKPFMKWFGEQGWEVHYASLGEEEVSCDKQFKVCFNRSPFSIDNIKAYGQIKKIIESENYDIIHTHTPMGGVVTRLAARAARKKGTKVIYTAHGFHFFKGAPMTNWLLYYPVEKWLSRYTDCLVTINYEDYNTAMCKKFKSKSIELINGVGVDLNKFSSVSQDEKTKLRMEYGYDPQDFILIYVAEFIKRKNHKFLIHRIADLQVSIPNIKVLLAGVGELYDECVLLAEQLKLSECISFMGYRRDISRLCQMSDIQVSTSKQEGLPVNIIEGMASGLPVVCAKIRGQTDIIEDGVNGFLYQVGVQKEFCEHIQRLYENPQFRIAMAENNLEKVEKYSLSNAIQNMSEIYKQMM